MNNSSTQLANYPDLLSASQLSEIFGVSKQTIYKELQSGKFGKPIKIGREYKVSKLYIEKIFINPEKLEDV